MVINVYQAQVKQLYDNGGIPLALAVELADREGCPVNLWFYSYDAAEKFLKNFATVLGKAKNGRGPDNNFFSLADETGELENIKTAEESGCVTAVNPDYIQPDDGSILVPVPFAAPAEEEPIRIRPGGHALPKDSDPFF